MTGFQSPVTLSGRWVRLEPLRLEHAPALRSAASDPNAFRFLLNGPGSTEEDLRNLITMLLGLRDRGSDLPFTITLLPSGRPVGMTRYLGIDRENHSVEVGGTWLDPTYWRTPVNTESKFLLLRHAFEEENCHRVSFQTDLRNERSQRAIERLGAVREAVFRDDKLLRDGTFRTSVVYGILSSEWPKVRAELVRNLAREWSPAGTAPSTVTVESAKGGP